MRSRLAQAARCGGTLLLILMLAAPAAAQGRGNAFGKGRNGAPAPSPTTLAIGESDGPTAVTPAQREFGSWLDDGSVLEPHTGWVALSLGRSYTTSGHQTDFPVVDSAIGWTRRLQFGVTLPYSRYTALDGTHASGRGDVYLNAKIALRDRLDTAERSALAVAPVIEILSAPDPSGGRLFWALPFSGEVRRDAYRVYGAAAYFSRGALFAGGALEAAAGSRGSATIALTWTRSLTDIVATDSGAARVDLSGSASYLLLPSVSVFGGIGRTLSSIDANSATMMLSGGVAWVFAPQTRGPRR